MVSPPPGVSSATSVMPERIHEAARQRQPQADTGGVVGVAESLKRREHPLPLTVRNAGPAIGDT